MKEQIRRMSLTKIQKLEAEVATLKKLYADDRQAWHQQQAESEREIARLRVIVEGNGVAG